MYADISLLSERNSINDQNGYFYPKPNVPFALPSVSRIKIGNFTESNRKYQQINLNIFFFKANARRKK